jgi:hypothetical protein
MVVYVRRNGVLVEKTKADVKPYRFKEYESPIDGALITSPRQRERDLNNSNSFDPRDLSNGHEWSRGRDAQKAEVNANRDRQQLDFWR